MLNETALSEKLLKPAEWGYESIYLVTGGKSNVYEENISFNCV